MSHIVACTACGAKNRLASADASRGSAAQKPTCGKCQAALPWIVDADASTFRAEIDQSPVPVLVDFWAAWCGPCRIVAPVLSELAGDLAGRLKVVKVDVDKSPVLAAKYGAQSIPLLAVFRDGEEVERQTGAVPKGMLRKMVEPYLAA